MDKQAYKSHRMKFFKKHKMSPVRAKFRCRMIENMVCIAKKNIMPMKVPTRIMKQVKVRVQECVCVCERGRHGHTTMAC